MTRQSNLNGCLWRIFVRRTAGSRIVLAMTGQSANWNRPQTPAVQWSNSAKELQNFMKTCFSAVTGYPGARSHFLGRLACIAFVSGSTISLSFAGFRDGGVRGSGGSFVGPVQRIGFTASHGNVDAHNPYPRGYRSGAMGYSEDRGSLVAPNRETVGSRNGFVPSPASQIGTIRRQEVIPQTRNSIHPQRPDPSELPLRDHNAAPRKSMLGGAKLGHNIYLPIRRPLMRAQGSTTNSSGMRISLLLTRGYPMAAESHSIGHEFSCST
jgi:hypothetical protein